MRKLSLVVVSVGMLIFSACSDSGAGGNQKSAAGQDVVKYENPTLGALSPRDGGYMDVNNSATPTLAVFNQGDDTINFELWGDSEFAELISSAQAVEKPVDTTYTPWILDVALESGKTYYWRAHTALGDWTALYSFTVKNLCDIGGVRWAEYAISRDTERSCDIIVRQDPNAALGSPDAGGYISNERPGSGFVTLDSSGSLIVEMGKTVLDGSGNDIRVFEFVSFEWVEVFAGNSEVGPWHSMGVAFCGDSCDFDLGRTGLGYARYIKIDDLMSPLSTCHQTSGADIDAVQALHTTYNSGQCG